MSEEPQKPQKTTNKINDQVQAAKEITKNVTNTTVNTADELYNKLPFDKINNQLAKLPFKLDAKSRGFKIGVAICTVLIILIGLKIVFGSSSPKQEAKREKMNESTYADATTERIGPKETTIQYDEENGVIRKKTETYMTTINNHKYKKEDVYYYDEKGVLKLLSNNLYLGEEKKQLSEISYYPNGNIQKRVTHNKQEEFDQNGKLICVCEPEKSQTYYPNGKVEYVRTGNKQIKFYDENGTLVFNLDGENETYEQGKVKRVRHETDFKYYENGVLLFEGTGAGGAYAGKFYHENGKLAYHPISADQSYTYDKNGKELKVWGDGINAGQINVEERKQIKDYVFEIKKRIHKVETIAFYDIFNKAPTLMYDRDFEDYLDPSRL